MPKAKIAAAKGMEIDKNLAEAHVSLGHISFTYDGDWPAAGKHFERALALNPAYCRAHTFYPFYLSSLGRSEEALEVAKRALDLDPASPAVSHSLAVQLYLARKFDQAIKQNPRYARDGCEFCYFIRGPGTVVSLKKNAPRRSVCAGRVFHPEWK